MCDIFKVNLHFLPDVFFFDFFIAQKLLTLTARTNYNDVRVLYRIVWMYLLSRFRRLRRFVERSREKR